MKKILILNGPNLNLLGVREPEKYGNINFQQYFETLKNEYKQIELDYYQSNIEGELVNKIHEVGFDYDGIVLNAAAYTHTSVAIADAIAAVNTPVIEVHITNTAKREPFRHKSYIAPVCVGTIAGFGLNSYNLAIRHFTDF
jgi:3-dehydroquinate dehydratase-2